ncbi:MAG: hypothetical protein BWY74_02812 [Firmicutes bacterium ADurb.Bin419]|nr:MAG: hypothetical protein BWY74_02812 [Firmicutes bacterium ADurb.Bin419]
MAWSKDVITWEENNYLCLSVPFTWLLPKAKAICLSNPNSNIAVGGPAVKLMPEYLSKYADIEPFIPSEWPLRKHNIEATRTSISCPNSCSFCLISRIEGEFRELQEFPPGRIIQDNNFFACSNEHIYKVVELIKDIKNIDFQGIDPARVTDEKIELIKSLSIESIKMGYDGEYERDEVFHALSLFEKHKIPKSKILLYCLINYGETKQEAISKLDMIKDRGYLPFAARYQPFNTLKFNEYVHPNWTHKELVDFCRYWNRQSWFGGITYNEYLSGPKPKFQNSLF